MRPVKELTLLLFAFVLLAGENVEGAGHGVNGWEKDPALETYKTKMLEWLKATLK